MLMKNGKKKAHPALAIGIGAMAIYGAYSMVSAVKDMCVDKAKRLSSILKKKDTKQKCDCDECECEEP